MRLVDTHAHLGAPVFRLDLEPVVERARSAGVGAIVCAGYDARSSREAVELARRLPGVWASVGIHPNEVASASEADFDEVARVARDPRVVGIGETGLAYYRDRTPRARQRQALAWHLRLAEELTLPAILHNRAADADVASALEDAAARGGPPGLLHCFSSTDPVYLERVLATRCVVSLAGVLTFKSNDRLREVVRHLPLDRLVVESDAPYLAPEPFRGRRNEPAFVRHTVERLAEIRGLPVADLVRRLRATSERVFPPFIHPGVEAA